MDNVLHVVQLHLLMCEVVIELAVLLGGCCEIMYAKPLPVCLTDIKYAYKLAFCLTFLYVLDGETQENVISYHKYQANSLHLCLQPRHSQVKEFWQHCT